MRNLFLSIAIGLGLLAIASSLSYRMAEARSAEPYDVLHVPSGGTARLVALGYRTLLSDLYWLSTVQYVGEPRAETRGWGKLFPLVDLVTDLDPRHGYAYQTAGIVLSAAGLLEESDAILKKGMEKGPPWWTFPYYLSFNQWFYRGNLPLAAKYAEIAAKCPGASPNISHLAVSLASKSGTPGEALTVLQELRATVKDTVTAQRLDEQIKLATLERDAQRLERAAVRVERARGWPIVSLEELVLAGAVTEIPLDPFGGRYLWDAQTKKVHSSANPFRFQLEEGSHIPVFQFRPRLDAKERALQ